MIDSTTEHRKFGIIIRSPSAYLCLLASLCFVGSAAVYGESIMKEIKLSQGKVALVDDKDFEELSRYKWYAAQRENYTIYAIRTIGTKPNHKTIRMHRQIMKARKGQQIDHLDGNGLLNVRSNLRLCTNSQNQQNKRKRKNCSSKFKGICWHKNRKKWEVYISLNKKLYYLGYFDDEIEAAKAYDRKAKEFFGEFARLNFPEVIT